MHGGRPVQVFVSTKGARGSPEAAAAAAAADPEAAAAAAAADPAQPPAACHCSDMTLSELTIPASSMDGEHAAVARAMHARC